MGAVPSDIDELSAPQLRKGAPAQDGGVATLGQVLPSVCDEKAGSALHDPDLLWFQYFVARTVVCARTGRRPHAEMSRRVGWNSASSEATTRRYSLPSEADRDAAVEAVLVEI